MLNVEYEHGDITVVTSKRYIFQQPKLNTNALLPITVKKWLYLDKQLHI